MIVEGVLAFLLFISGLAFGALLSKYQKLKKRITWVESYNEQIETFIELQRDLQDFGKATMEVRRLDQGGIFYREPIK